MRRRSKWILSAILLLAFPAALVFFFHQEILLKAGKFMAPGGNYEADVAVIEGSDYLSEGMAIRGIHLFSSGRVKRIVVVLHRIAELHRPYGLNGGYTDLVSRKLRDKGLKDSDFKIVETPIRNPVTLTEARVVMDHLSREKVKSAILVSPGFHTRRSCLAYRFAGTPFQIEVFPDACFTEYEPDQWWKDYAGIRDFATETGKLAYYLVGGYIPLRLSY